mmetsp:Transcript_16737/g.37529  ORF Transcript_16737/g.37529 Transcript_16737/m.37529 type:complete len:403 (-) Transcript_16737:926-2134(-)
MTSSAVRTVASLRFVSPPFVSPPSIACSGPPTSRTRAWACMATRCSAPVYMKRSRESAIDVRVSTTVLQYARRLARGHRGSINTRISSTSGPSGDETLCSLARAHAREPLSTGEWSTLVIRMANGSIWVAAARWMVTGRPSIPTTISAWYSVDTSVLAVAAQAIHSRSCCRCVSRERYDSLSLSTISRSAGSLSSSRATASPQPAAALPTSSSSLVGSSTASSSATCRGGKTLAAAVATTCLPREVTRSFACSSASRRRASGIRFPILSMLATSFVVRSPCSAVPALRRALCANLASPPVRKAACCSELSQRYISMSCSALRSSRAVYAAPVSLLLSFTRCEAVRPTNWLLPLLVGPSSSVRRIISFSVALIQCSSAAICFCISPLPATRFCFSIFSCASIA